MSGKYNPYSGEESCRARQISYVATASTGWAFHQVRDVGLAYDDNTRKARHLNNFGSLNFVARGEPFWGDDRLDDAIACTSTAR